LEQDIFIELAGELRCSILLKLREKGEYKQSLLTKDLDVTVQEAHRQVERLVNTGLAYRDSGFLRLTPYGSIITAQLPCFDFNQI
jgi:predicted transcriptional regulator